MPLEVSLRENAILEGFPWQLISQQKSALERVLESRLGTLKRCHR